MDAVILVNKEKNYTSRDIVNIVSKKLNTKKVGHFGTLDPLATGLLVIGIGSLTKLDNFSLFDTKEYIAEVLVGTKTDTYDITGNIIKQETTNITKKEIEEVLNSFNKTYLQEVPIYSAVKVNGKKLYEYARNNETVELPKKEVTVSNIKLLDMYEKENNQYFKFSCTVSKGTYIRSLINDISKELDIPMCMSNLIRTKQGKFSLRDANTLEDIEQNNIKFLDICDVLPVKEEVIPKTLEKQIMSGNLIAKQDAEYVLFINEQGKKIVLYQKYNDQMKPCFFFKN